MEPIEVVYRREAPQVLATLIRLLGSFDLAEEAMQMAFLAASRQWPGKGMPRNARAWLVSTGRFKAIDMLRRRKRFQAIAPELAALQEMDAVAEPHEDETMPDDMLRLIFVCCHPALPADAQTALCLREVCGLTTEAIAAAFLTKPATVAQRIVRAKARIRDERVPYSMPEGAERDGRLDVVLRVVYLLFSEGYAASAGMHALKADLCAEAIRLARLVRSMLPSPDIAGLLGLMLIQQSREKARYNAGGDIVLLGDQDRRLWDADLVREGLALAKEAMAHPPFSTYALQAAIAAEHARTSEADRTDWGRITELYDLLRVADPGPIVELNRAIALGMRDGPEAALPLITHLAAGELSGYKFALFARADFLDRAGYRAAAATVYAEARKLDLLASERRFIDGRLQELTS